jgi:hypothetical protein
MKATGVAVVALLAGVGLAGSALAGPRSSSCTAGVHTVGGANVRTFCGPAKATAKTAGKTFSFSGGQCSVTQGYFTVNIGSITLPPAKAKFAYLGIDVKPPRAGVHRNQIVSWQVPGKGYSIIGATVTVRAGLKSGTFAGRVIGGGNATGSFSCS